MNSKQKTSPPSHSPWKDQKGKPLPIRQLRKVSKRWSPLVWKNYLLSLEAPQREQLFQNGNLVDEKRAEGPFDLPPAKTVNPEILLAMRSAMKRLSPKEQLIIRGLFFRRKSVHSLARGLGITRQSVLVYKARAFKKLHTTLSTLLPLYIEGSEEETGPFYQFHKKGELS